MHTCTSASAILRTLVLRRLEDELREHPGGLSDETYERALARAFEECCQSVWAAPPSATPESIQLDITRFAEQMGAGFEELRGLRPQTRAGSGIRLVTSPDRRDRGVYYTPVALADSLTFSTLTRSLKSVRDLDDLRGVSIVDPAAGCGAFLLAAVRVASEILGKRPGFKGQSRTTIKRAIASHCVYGVDVDPVAVAASRQLLVLQVGDPTWDGRELDSHLRIADAVASTIDDWRSWFPEVFTGEGSGFSVVLTNPPWSKVRPLRREFFIHLDLAIRAYQGTSLGRYLETHLGDLAGASWKEYAARTSDASARLRRAPGYRINEQKAGGDTDLYKYFVERCTQLLSNQGFAGMLLPSGVLRALGSRDLRLLLTDDAGHVVELVEYINRRHIFPIHSMYRFCTVVFSRQLAGGVRSAVFGQTEPLEHGRDGGVSLSRRYLHTTGGDLALIPEVRNQSEKRILERLCRAFPRLGDSPDWSISFRRELDMTNDSAQFIERADAERLGFIPGADGRWLSESSADVLLPLYEGRMVAQFNSSAKAHVGGQGRGSVWRVLEPGDRSIIPHYLVRESFALSRGWTPRPRAAYCEISGHANERTIQASLISSSAVCGNKVPVVSIGDNTVAEHYAWLSLSNSFVVDWMMRRWVSTTVNFFYWLNVPFPALAWVLDNERQSLEAVEELCSGRVAPDVGANEWLGRRAMLRAYVDARVMLAYGITGPERETILEDFPLVRARDRDLPDSIGTLDLVSRAHCAALSGSLNFSDLPASLDCTYVEAANAYVSGEVAKMIRREQG